MIFLVHKFLMFSKSLLQTELRMTNQCRLVWKYCLRLRLPSLLDAVRQVSAQIRANYFVSYTQTGGVEEYFIHFIFKSETLTNRH
jgi:hypothetical protein